MHLVGTPPAGPALVRARLAREAPLATTLASPRPTAAAFAWQGISVRGWWRGVAAAAVHLFAGWGWQCGVPLPVKWVDVDVCVCVDVCVLLAKCAPTLPAAS